jgi:hypothetical protein
VSMFVLAHVGHWTTSLAFFGPVLILPLALYLMARFGNSGDRD